MRSYEVSLIEISTFRAYRRRIGRRHTHLYGSIDGVSGTLMTKLIGS